MLFSSFREAPTFKVGDRVLFTGKSASIPAGSEGEIVEVMGAESLPAKNGTPFRVVFEGDSRMLADIEDYLPDDLLASFGVESVSAKCFTVVFLAANEMDKLVQV